MVDGGAYERYGVIAISMASPLTPHVDIDRGYLAQVLSLAHEHFADFGQELLSTVTLGIRVAVHQRNAQCHPG